MYWKTFLLTFAILLPGQPARAEAGWTDAARIISVETNIFGRTVVELDLRKNPSGCKEKARFFRETTGDSSDNMLEMLVEAATTQTPVKLRVTGACHLKGYAEYNAVAIVP
jgi:hypothetical protein